MTVETLTQPTTQSTKGTLTYRCPYCCTPLEVDAIADGSVVNCPAPGCGKPFRVAVPVAEPVSPSGNFASPVSPTSDAQQPKHIVLPPGTEPPPPAPAVATSITPAVAATPSPATSTAPIVANTSAPVAEDPEGPPHVIHLSMWGRYPFRCLTYLLAELGCLAGVIYGVHEGWHLLTVPSAVLMAVVGGKFFLWWLRMRCTVLTITNKRLILTSGVFSKTTKEFELARIVDFNIHQTLLMRWLNVGDLAVVGANAQVVIMAVPDPHGVIAFLQGHIAQQKQAEQQPDVVVVQQPVPVPPQPAQPT